MSSLPLVASRIRLSASWARVLTGWVGSCPVASLYSNSAADAGYLRMVTNGTAAPAARSPRRVMPCECFLSVFMMSLLRPGACRNNPDIVVSSERLCGASVCALVIFVQRVISSDHLAIVGMPIAVPRHSEEHLMRESRQRQRRLGVTARFEYDAEILDEDIDGTRNRRFVLQHAWPAVLQHPARSG